MQDTNIVVLENEDILKFSALYYDELLLQIPNDAIALGAISTRANAVKAVGLLIFHIREGIAFVDWLYVDEAFRLRGVGTALMNSLKEAIYQAEEAEVDSISLSFTRSAGELAPFLERNGFAVAFGLGNYNVVAPLDKVRLIRADENGKLRAVPLKSVPASAFAEFDNVINELGDVVVGVESPIAAERYREESRAILNGDQIVGVLLVSDTAVEDNISIDWAYAMPRYMLHAIPLAFNAVMSELKKNCKTGTVISMASLTPQVHGIVRKTMPSASFTEIYGAMWALER